MYDKNSGKSPFPSFLKRIKLPKKHTIDYCPQPDYKKDSDFYNYRELLVGMNIIVFNRKFLLVDCDDFTRNFYEQNLGIKQGKI